MLSHSLASVSLQSGMALHLFEAQPEQARAALLAIRQSSTDALGQARAALTVVREAGEPLSARVPGLADLGALAASVRAAGLDVDLHTDLDARLVSETTGATAYRVFQEALTNVMRHAGPGAHARARAEHIDGWLVLDVTDDGVGIEAPKSGAGHGLRGMAERVSAVGGELQVGPAPDGGGFTVHARLPMGSAR